MFNLSNILNSMVQRNPQLGRYWNMAQQLTNGKSPAEVQTIAQNLAKQNGLDLNQVKSEIRQITNQFNGNGSGF